MAFAQQGPKYVFYFIGDGMGVNQVNATETYLAAVEGRRGIKPLTFPSFPNVALVNT
ncbi:MAG: alkaline phosphatase, partial [Prevotellaceae bacterium]|nr:alkaline phosphatase [Prevotellaceae bacterium]